ncbi:TFIIB-type zinc ribbon-containing protein [Salinactinospora qingdaonensis]
MMTVDRKGIHLEQCERCRGIFLDHGELEQIVSAEQHHYGMAPAYGYSDSPKPYQHGRPDSPPPFHGHPDSPKPYRGGYGGYSDSPRPYGHKKRKRSFLEDLFD